ncbi:hypothetical protein FHG87_005086 [Trinorchestia longiramus]|nr:hypothetical protein FHG87_005086 [Trinorchestia longiramus]
MCLETNNNVRFKRSDRLRHFRTMTDKECSKYDHERESFMDVVREQYEENQWNARCVEEDSGMRYLVGLDEE